MSYDMKQNVALSSCTFPVQYTNQRLDVTSFMDAQASGIIEQINRTLEMEGSVIAIDDKSLVYIPALLINMKHKSWDYECEFRCSRSVNDAGMPYLEATPKEIYIGINCTNENIRALERIANGLQIPAYRMGFDERSSRFELTARR